MKKRIFRYASQEFCSINDNKNYVFAARHALNIYRSDSIFTYIPKNACSTMRYSISVDNGLINEPEQIGWIHSNSSIFSAGLAELVKARYTFTILRDPHTRIGSCFLDQIVGQKDPARTFAALMNNQVEMTTLTFRQFVLSLAPHLNENVHWQPQVSFLVYSDYDDYFCVESLDEAARSLRDRIGFEIVDARNLTRHGTDQYQKLDGDDSFADTPSSEILKMKQAGFIPRYDRLYDQELYSIIANLYFEDLYLYKTKINESHLMKLR